MGNQWDADIQLTEQDAGRLIAEQFPQFAPARYVLLGAGWDNIALLVDERSVFRFPRRQVAADLLEREVRILPLLAPHLPLCIPVPEYLGTPTPDYPYAFAGYPVIPGRTACQFVLADHERATLAPAIAGFLAALHGIPIDADTLTWAPRDELMRADVATRVPQVKERLVANVAELPESAVRALLELVDELGHTPISTRPLCWVHGDLYSRHLLLNDAHHPTGVIDWGDVHLGDPALDLSIAFSFLPPAARLQFRQFYGEIDDATWQRARFRAIHYGPLLVEYGRSIGDAAMRQIGAYALRWAAMGP